MKPGYVQGARQVRRQPMQLTTIRHILEVKGFNIWSISPEASVLDALAIMSDKDVGALLVMKGDQMTGILSERDYARKVILLGKTSRNTRVDEIMSWNVVTIHPDQTVEEAMELMNNKHIRHLPVKENERVVGMISIGDLVKAIMFKQREEIKNLEGMLVSYWQH
jgi:CBS domain-containing protein